jgi:hypothetical protein
VFGEDEQSAELLYLHEQQLYVKSIDHMSSMHLTYEHARRRVAR